MSGWSISVFFGHQDETDIQKTNNKAKINPFLQYYDLFQFSLVFKMRQIYRKQTTCHILTFISDKLTKCQLHRYSVGNGPAPETQFTPTCTATGAYNSTQCHPVSGECWCVTKEGFGVVGTRTLLGEDRPTCEGDLHEKHRYSQRSQVLSLSWYGAPIGGIRGFPAIKMTMIHQMRMYCGLSVKVNMCEMPDIVRRLIPQLEPHDWYHYTGRRSGISVLCLWWEVMICDLRPAITKWV